MEEGWKVLGRLAYNICGVGVIFGGFCCVISFIVTKDPVVGMYAMILLLLGNRYDPTRGV